MAQIREAIDALAQWGTLEQGLAVALFHVMVVFEEGDVVGGAFHAGDQPRLVVELEAGGAHVVMDAGALDAGREVVAQLVLEAPGELVAEEHRHVLGLDGVHGGAHDRLIRQTAWSVRCFRES